MSGCWVVIPAAGIGRRMQSERPKQYLELVGMPVLSHVLHRFSELPRIDGIVVALHPDDRYWDSISKPVHVPVRTVAGGAERCHSVCNALDALAGEADPRDWVLVHDAARPCVRMGNVRRLLRNIESHPAGGLLALPINDTVKRADAAMQAEATIDRNALWRAQTPQVFRYGLLQSALKNAISERRLVTDESQAMELAGHKPLLVAGSPDNIKVTDMRDMKLAELYLELQARERHEAGDGGVVEEFS